MSAVKRFLGSLGLLIGLVAFAQAQTCNYTVNTTPVSCYGGSNGSATITLPPDLQGALKCKTSPTPPVSCSTCSNPISTNTDITITNGQTVCLKTYSYNKTITFSGGGNLIICGHNVRPVINLTNTTQAITITVLGTAYFSNANMGQNVTVNNYGTLTCTNTIGFNGKLNNYDTLTVAGTLNINSVPATLYNTGVLTVNENCLVDASATADNSGIMTVLGGLTCNSSGKFTNNCTLSIMQGLIVNSFFQNEGTTNVTGQTLVNGNGSVLNLQMGTKFSTTTLWSDGTIAGLGTSCSQLKTTGNATLNSGSVTGRVGLCVGGTLDKRATVASTVTTNCSCQPSGNVTYSWTTSTGAVLGTGSQITGLAKGNYNVTITLPGCAPLTKPFEITQPASPLAITFGKTSSILTAIPSGGTSPYPSYLWSTAETTPSISYTHGIKYTVTVKDFNNCTKTDSITVPVCNINQATLTHTVQGQVVTLQATGGQAPYTYDWGDGYVGQQRTNPPKKIYTITVTDANYCSFTKQITYPCDVTITATPPACSPGNKGTVTVEIPGGGTPGDPGSPSNNPATCATIPAATESCDGVFDTKITQNMSEFTVTDGKKICLNASTYTGGIVFKGSGHLVICQNASPAYINFNQITGPVKITVLGKLNVANLDMVQGSTVDNFGEIYTLGSGYNGQLNNYGKITEENYFNINDIAGNFYNAGTLIVKKDFNNKKNTVNAGTITVGGYFNNNSGSSFTNLCRLSVGKDLNLNNPFTNQGYVTVVGSTNMNSNGTLTTSPGSGLVTKDLMMNTTIVGTGSSCSLVRVTGKTTVNSGGSVTGPVDFCRPSGSQLSGPPPTGSITPCSCPITVDPDVPTLTTTMNTTPAGVTINWGDGIASTSLTKDLLPGTYEVTINLPGCNPIVKTVVVPPLQNPVMITATAQDQVVTATVQGGKPPYTINWPGGATQTLATAGTANRTFLFGGTYQITVLDSNKCSSTTSVTVEGQGVTDTCKHAIEVILTRPNYNSVTVLGKGDDGTYQYIWADGYTGPDPKSRTDLQEGNYYIVFVRAPNKLCSGNAIIDLRKKVTSDSFSVSIIPTSPKCFNDANGTLDVTVINGSGDYIYTLNNSTQYNTPNITGLSAGSYTLTVWDVKRQQSVEKTFTLSNPSQLTIGIQYDADGKPIAIPSGGGGGYLYKWYETGELTAKLNNPTSSGMYTVEVKDANGCVITRTVPWGLENCHQTVNVSTQAATCGTNGSATVNSPLGNYRYIWNTPWQQESRTVSNLGGGTYHLLVLNSNQDNCVVVDTTITINSVPKLFASATYDPVSDKLVGAGTNGTQPYTYAWSGAGSGTTKELLNPVPGLYRLDMKDVNNCPSTAYVYVPLKPCPTNVTVGGDDVKCAGGKDGSAFVTVTGSGYSYYWHNASPRFNSSVSGLAKGEYYVTITKNGPPACLVGIFGRVVRQPDSLKVTGYSILDNSTAFINIQGGAPLYKVVWNDGYIGQQRANLAKGLYTVTVTDSRGCGPVVFTFEFNPCNLKAFAVVDDGDVNVKIVQSRYKIASYTWTPNLNNTLNGPHHVITTDGTYQIIVKDVKGCKDTMTAIVGTRDCGLVASLSNPTDASCPERCDGKLSINVTASLHTPKFIWNGVEQTASNDKLCSNTYEIYVLDPVESCAIPFTAEIGTTSGTCPKQSCSDFTSTLISQTDEKCFGDNKASATVKINGGVAPYTVIWTDAQAHSDTNLTSYNLSSSSLSPGSYTFLAQDKRNCTTAVAVTIRGPLAPLQVSFTTGQNNAVSCPGGADGSAQLTVSGGTPSYTFIWKKNNVLVNQAGGNSAGTYTKSGLTPGSYTIEVSDAHGCGSGDGITIQDKQLGFDDIFASDASLCPDEKVDLYVPVVSGYTYNWNCAKCTQTGYYNTRQLAEPDTVTLTLTPTNSQCASFVLGRRIKLKPGCGTKIEDNPLCTFVPMKEADPKMYDNFCEVLNVNIAYQNATFKFKQYVDDQRKAYRERYIRRCLDAQESWTVKYKDKEHHYTLHYYDQAGNLVRTVPPQGVVLLDDQGVADAIAARRSGERVYTDHDLQSTYQYNSMNQPVRQDIPDHDRQDVVYSTVPTTSSALPATATYTGGQFLDPDNGFVIANNNGTGFIYQAKNGGSDLSSLATVNYSTLHAVYALPGGSVLVATGENASFLSSADNGATWKYLGVPAPGYTFEHVHFQNANTGVVIASNGVVYGTGNGGSTWTYYGDLNSKINSQTVSDVYFKPSTMEGWAIAGDRIFATSNGTTWSEQVDISATQLGAIATLASSADYITYAGQGIFLSKTSSESNWKIQASTLPSSTLVAKLVATSGNTIFVLTSDSKAFKLVYDGIHYIWNATEIPSLVSGAETLVDLNLQNNNPYVLSSTGRSTNLNAPSSPTAISGTVKANRLTYSQTLAAFVAGAEGTVGNVYYNTGAGWQKRSYDAPNLTELIDVLPYDQDNLLVIDKDNKVFYLNKTATTAPWAAFGTKTAKAFYPMDYSSGFSAWILYTDGTLGYITYNTAGATPLARWTVTAATNAALTTTNLMGLSLGVPASATTPAATGFATYSNGTLLQMNGAATPIDWSKKLKGMGLTTVAAASNGAGYVGGANGVLLEKLTAASNWVLKDKYLGATAYDLSDLQPNGTAQVLEGTNSGSLFLFASPYTTPSAVTLSSPTGTGVTEMEGDYVLYGDAVYVFNRTTLTAQPIATTTANSIASNGTIVSSAGSIRNLSGTTYTPVSADKITLPNLQASALDGGTAYVAGDLGLVLTSSDGASWNIAPTPIREKITKVAVNGGNLVAIANAGNLYKGTPTSLALSNPSVTATWADVGNYANTFVLVGSAGNALLSTGGAWSAITPIAATAQLKAVYVVDATFAYAVGDAGVMYSLNLKTKVATESKKINGTTWSGGKNLVDVWFSDYKTGTALAADGTLLKTTDGGKTWNDVSGLLATNGIANGSIVSRGSPDSGMETDLVVLGAGAKATTLHDESDLFGTRNWYDEVGRLIVSQNPRQFYKYKGTGYYAYSYTVYDAVGRMVEVGEIKQAEADIIEKQAITSGGCFVNYKTGYLPWLNKGVRSEVTRTFYDLPAYQVQVNESNFTQTNLRPRIASVTFTENKDGSASLPAVYDRATHYSYDVHGNVTSLVQEIKVGTTTLAKQIDYQFDLISGKVTQIHYQAGQLDQFYQKYEYDADNRIVAVYTSRDNRIWEKDASYKFYAHGPLARMELGDLNVQGSDYAYTLQGWVKAVNATNLASANDPGKDGATGSKFAPDVQSYSLNYFEGDYKPILTAGNGLLASTAGLVDYSANAPDLFSANAKSIVTTLSNGNQVLSGAKPANAPMAQMQAFKYDQLMRIKQMLAYQGLDATSNAWSGASGNWYRNSFDYDADGNMAHQDRYSEAGVQVENLTYRYYDKNYIATNGKQTTRTSHRLAHVTEPGGPSADPTDLENQAKDNYLYDPTGNLTQDAQEGIKNIRWSVYGKIVALVRADTVKSRPDLEFFYDARNHRIAKVVKPRANGTLLAQSEWTYTFYVRDGQGLTLATYDKKGSALTLEEQHIYGVDRVGTLNPGTNMAGSLANDGYGSRSLGLKRYELATQMGNVLAVVSDLRTGTTADIKSLSDYAPFGLALVGRSYQEANYRYGFNGMERLIDWNGKVNTYIANERPLDPRLGRWLRLDPELDKFPESSPYAAMDNDPTNKMDQDGDIWNFIAGAAIGAAMDYGMQVAGNLAQGKSVGDALTQVDKTSILISAASGALTSGASALGGKVVKVVAKEAIDVGEKVVRKAVDNARAGKPLISGEDLKGVAVDYAKDKVTGLVQSKATSKLAVAGKPPVKPVTRPTVKPSPSTGKPPVGAGLCFVKGTLIFTSNGLKPIEEISVGDSVWAYSDSLHRKDKRRVYNTVIRETEALVKLRIGKEYVFATPDHPFYVKQKWVKAKNLKEGDLLTLANGAKEPIKSISPKDTTCTVYNFAVEEYHTYYVSASKILVHNNNPCAQTTGKGTQPVKSVNKNSNDAEGHFVLYEVEAKDGTILKVGKANADDVMADGTIRRVHTSERLAKKAGHEDAKAKVVQDLGQTTTGAAKTAEANRVQTHRANGNALPLNKEKDKRYK